MNPEQEIILNQAIALSLLYGELARLQGMEAREIMNLTCANVANVKKDADETTRMQFLQQAELETSIIQDFDNDI